MYQNNTEFIGARAIKTYEKVSKKSMSKLEKLLKDLDLAIAKIKEIDRKVKEKVKSAILEGDKIKKVSA